MATCVDNSAYGTPKPQEENYTSNYHSMVGSYEVPIKTLKKTSNEQRDLEGANRTLNTLFVDSTFEEESHAIGQEADEVCISEVRFLLYWNFYAVFRDKIWVVSSTHMRL